MALKFQCKNCGEDIVVRFLKVGEAAECKSCRTSNSVPESAEEISDTAISAEPVQSVPIAKALRRVGRIVIGFGVIAGIAGAVRVMIRHPAPDQTIALAVSVGITGLGIMFFFCILGVICLGIAKVIELLTK
jgi:uncharacterized paraquat-inducible protein A